MSINVNKIVGWSLCVLAVALFVAVTLFFVFVDPLAEAYVRRLDESPNMLLRVDSLDIHPLRGEAYVYGLDYKNLKKHNAALHIDSLYAQVELLPLLKREFILSHFHAYGFRGHFIRTQARHRLPQFIRQGSELARRAEMGLGWHIRLQDVVIPDCHVFFQDMVNHHDWDYTHGDVRLQRFCFENTVSTGSAACSLGKDGGGARTWFRYNALTTTYCIHGLIDTFRVDQMQDMYSRFVPLRSTQTRLSGDVVGWGQLNHFVPTLHGRGSLHFGPARVQLTKYWSAPIRMDSMNVAGFRLDYPHDRMEFGEMRLSNVCTNYQGRGREADLVGLNVKVNDATVVHLQPTLGRYRVTVGTILYRDHTFQSPFTYTLSHIRLSGRNFRLHGQNSALFQATLPHGGTLAMDWRGGLDVRHDKEYMRLQVNNALLTDLNPVLQNYMARTFTSGRLCLRDTTSLSGGRINSQNRVDIYDIEVSRRDKELTEAQLQRVPLRFLVHLMRDLDGAIHLSVPITGTLDHPEISVHQIVRQVKRNLWHKILEAPARFFRRMFGLDAKTGRRLSKAERKLQREQQQEMKAAKHEKAQKARKAKRAKKKSINE